MKRVERASNALEKTRNEYKSKVESLRKNLMKLKKE